MPMTSLSSSSPSSSSPTSSVDDDGKTNDDEVCEMSSSLSSSSSSSSTSFTPVEEALHLGSSFFDSLSFVELMTDDQLEQWKATNDGQRLAQITTMASKRLGIAHTKSDEYAVSENLGVVIASTTQGYDAVSTTSGEVIEIKTSTPTGRSRYRANIVFSFPKRKKSESSSEYKERVCLDIMSKGNIKIIVTIRGRDPHIYNVVKELLCMYVKQKKKVSTLNIGCERCKICFRHHRLKLWHDTSDEFASTTSDVEKGQLVNRLFKKVKSQC